MRKLFSPRILVYRKKKKKRFKNVVADSFLKKTYNCIYNTRAAFPFPIDIEFGGY